MWFSSWLKNRMTNRAARRRKLRRAAPPRFRPRLEALEDRCLLSAGALDTSFGNNGLVTTDFLGPTSDHGRAVSVVQTDGKIVVAGYSQAAITGHGTALVRYNADGSLDTSFGDNGKVIPDYSSYDGAIDAMTLQPDGKIVVAGFNFLARYNSDGSTDTSFGPNGSGENASGYLSNVTSLAIQPDTADPNGFAIVAAGESFHSGSFSPDFAVERYTSAGILDTSFGTDGSGEVSTDFGGSDVPNSVAIQSNGEIVAAGTTYQNNVVDFALARYTANGNADTSFGTDGKVVTSFSDYRDVATSVAIQPDAADPNGFKIVAAGWSEPFSGPPDFIVARYNSDGSLDTNSGFGTNGSGVATADFGGNGAEATSMTIQSNDDIVVAGYSYQGPSTLHDFALARFTSNGILDTGDGSPGSGFGTNGNGGGKVLTDFGNTDDGAFGVALLSNGEIVAAGTSYQPGTGADFAVALYTTSGALDSNFNSTGNIPGTVTTNIGAVPTDDFGQGGLALQADGKLVVAGVAQGPYFDDFALARYLMQDTTINGVLYHAGDLDPTFGNGGEVLTNLGGRSVATSMAIQADGKLVVAGWTIQGSTREFALARYNPDGSLDSSFGTGGEVITEFGVFAEAHSMAIQDDGSIVVAGESVQPGTGDEFALARYTSGGKLDSTFGSGGVALTSFGGNGDIANSVAIQPNGQIVAAGYSFQKNVGLEFALARYNSDGSLDSSFGKKGEVLTSFGGYGYDVASSVAIQSDGSIVVAGTSDQSTGDDFALARYTSSGSLDKSFNKNGEVLTNLGSYDNEAFALALQGDGKIVVAGDSFQSGHGYDFALARYNSDGSLDTGDGSPGTGFGNGTGFVLTSFGGESQVLGMVIQSDGNIVAAGTAYQIGQGYDFALARYFGVSPSTPIDDIDAIITNVQTLAATGVLTNGQGNSLETKLQDAIEYLGDGETTKAESELQAFINEVNDYIKEGILSLYEGQLLIDEADAVIALLQQA